MLKEKDYNCNIKEIKHLTDSAYILKLDKLFDFIPGQYLNIEKDSLLREYSIYNSNKEEHLEVLIREIKDGIVSKKLKQEWEKPINIYGPYGDFTLKNKDLKRKLLFIATGTGISPFHSFVKSYDIDYKIVHGVRYSNESYGKEDFDPERHILCATRGGGDFNGRVTEWLENETIDSETLIYLCGNCDMINDVQEILERKKHPLDNIREEVFF